MTTTFNQWLRRQVRAEGPDGMTESDAETVINEMPNVALLDYFEAYQHEVGP